MNSSKVLRGTVRGKEDISVGKRDEECQREFERWSEEFLILFYLKDGERGEGRHRRKALSRCHILKSSKIIQQRVGKEERGCH